MKAALMMGGVALCVLSAVPAWADTTVTIHDYAFVPDVVEIKKGETVRWVNADESPHNVMTDPKTFKSAPLDTKDEYSHRFDATGSFDYFCQLHPHMKGRVIVK